MAKDDYPVIVYQILAYLYKCLKTGEKVDSKMLDKNSPYFIVGGQKLSDHYWCFILYNLQRQGYINGIMFSRRAEEHRYYRPKEWSDCMITVAGIEYLTDNNFMQKAKAFLQDEIDIEPFT